MGLIVDSSVFIGLERRMQTLDTLFAAVPEEPLVLSAVTASEILVGIHRADSPERRGRRKTFVEDLLERLPALEFDLTVARIHARLWAELASAGQLIGAHELIIAATAVAHDYTVLTDNLRDFNRVPGLEIRQPGW